MAERQRLQVLSQLTINVLEIEPSYFVCRGSERFGFWEEERVLKGISLSVIAWYFCMRDILIGPITYFSNAKVHIKGEGSCPLMLQVFS